jgi:hypothetical protein
MVKEIPMELYEVKFDNGDAVQTYQIVAHSPREAVIQAQAEQIKKGWQFDVYTVRGDHL